MKPHRLILSMAVLLTTFLWITPAHAQTVCGERAKFIEDLAAQYLEQPVAIGLTSSGAVIEVYVSPKGSWSILLTYPNGSTCMVAAGRSWESLPRPVAGELSSFKPIVHMGCLDLSEVMDRFFNEFGMTVYGWGYSTDNQQRETMHIKMTSPNGDYIDFVVRDGCVVGGTAGERWRTVRGPGV